MAFGIKLVQGGVTLAAGTATHGGPITVDPNVLCYVTFTGTTTSYKWTLTPTAGGHAVISSATSAAPTFLPDIASWAGSVQLEDDAANVYVLDIVTATAAVPATSSAILYATSYGVKADGRRITDGVTTAGSNVLQSATANFTQADVGKSVLLRTPSNPLPAGTVTLGIGNVLIIGTAPCAFNTSIPNISGVCVNGGCIYVDGEYFAILAVESNTQLHVRTAPIHNVAGAVLYRETQLATTIASVTDATHAVLAMAGGTILVSETSVPAFIASDDTAACTAAETAAWGGPELVYPGGLIGISSNRVYLNKTGLTMRGQGKEKTIFVDLRLASVEYPVGTLPNDGRGFLSFNGCTDVHISDMSYDGSVPVLGMGHTTGGIANNSGGRIGFFTTNCENTSFIEVGYERYGARDEHTASAAVVGNNQIWENIGPASPGSITNNITINPGGVGKGCRIINCVCAAAQSGIQWAGYGLTCIGCDVSQPAGFTEGVGADPIVLEPFAGGYALLSDYIIHDVDSHAFGSGLINVDGSQSDAASVVDIKDGLIVRNTGYFFNSDSGIFRISSACKGTINIQDNTCDKNTAASSGGTFVTVAGNSTLAVHLKGNTFRGRAGSNMTRGVVTNVNVPTGTVIDDGGNVWGESVTSTFTIGTGTATGRVPIAAAPIDVVTTIYTATPESAIVGSPGALCIDTVNGEIYIKVTGTSTNTGWKKITHA